MAQQEDLQQNMLQEDHQEQDNDTNGLHLNGTNGTGDRSPIILENQNKEQAQSLKEKDELEKKSIQELKDSAKRELDDWYKQYEENLRQTKEKNRQDERALKDKVNGIVPGTEWERVANLCDFTEKDPEDEGKDTSRMRSILLQLKQKSKQ